MNVLIVDDQVSVLSGIAYGVHFDKLGIDEVRYATCAQEAMDILEKMPIDIMYSDIEMPGVSGLELNRMVREKYPDVVRILLTCHADFAYAQESIKQGCFDYLLQPVSFEEIEESLSRAIQFIIKRKKRNQLAQLGQMLKTSEMEFMDRVVLNLFSGERSDVQSSMQMLSMLGYPLNKEKKIQLLLINSPGFIQTESPITSEKAIHKHIANGLKQSGLNYPILSFSTINHKRQFLVVLFSATEKDINISYEQFQGFYSELRSLMEEENLGCYVGNVVSCGNARAELKRMLSEEVQKKEGITLSSNAVDHTHGGETNLALSVERWKTLLMAGQKRILENEIEAYLANTVEKSISKHKLLCELHQQLTHIFFSYFYDNDATVQDLFNDQYSYTDYMGSFTDSASLRASVQYMLRAVDRLQKNNLPMDDVERAKSFIAENIANPITVKDVADYVSLSAEYFTKLFKRETGQNIKEYITLSKISAAKEILEHSSISVGMVALELGYSNFSHFTQIFKKYENMTPSEYRNRFTNE